MISNELLVAAVLGMRPQWQDMGCELWVIMWETLMPQGLTTVPRMATTACRSRMVGVMPGADALPLPALSLPFQSLSLWGDRRHTREELTRFKLSWLRSPPDGLRYEYFTGYAPRAI